MLDKILIPSALRHSKRPALVEGARTLTHGELLCVARRFGRRLRQSGLNQGDIAILPMNNSVESVCALFAIWDAGATALLLDPTLKPQEIAGYARRAAAAWFVHTGGAQLPAGLDGIRTLNMPQVEELLGAPLEDGSIPKASRPLDNVAAILCSSGTTGRPKLVPRTAGQLLAASEIFQRTLPCRAEDRVLAVLPFFHSFGLLYILLTALRAGAALHLQRFVPRSVVKYVERNDVTILPAAPFMIRLLAQTDLPSPPNFSSVRLAVSAGSALPPPVAKAFQEKFGVSIARSYGTTETGPIALVRPEDNCSLPGWAGAPYDGVEVAIKDPSGGLAPPTRDGRIVVRSPAVATHYLNDAEATRQVFEAGWVLTGDVGRLDERGGLWITGRQKPMLAVAGKKVSPAEVEACLVEHPAVEEAFVQGVPAGDGNDRIKAFVVTSAPVSAVELMEFCSRRLADFKVPREIQFVKTISRGPMGKPGLPADEGSAA